MDKRDGERVVVVEGAVRVYVDGREVDPPTAVQRDASHGDACVCAECFAYKFKAIG
jgi:hypothetical protein